MTFLPCGDQTPADWIATCDVNWWSVVTLGPPGFATYARLRFIPDPAYEGQTENEVAGMYNVPSDTDQLRLAVKTLLQHTSLSVDGYVLLWDGWGVDAFPEAVLHMPRVVLPNREYYLCRVSLAGYVSGIAENAWQAETNHPMPLPSFIWPSDQSWCITKDVDPHWAGIGGDQDLIEQLLAEHSLDVVPLETNEILPFYL